jgi:quercetin dioxygenase-like cupin family protein
MVIYSKEVENLEVGKGIKRKILANSPTLMICEVTFAKGAVGAIHKHFHEQIAYVKKGSFTYYEEDKTFSIKEGDSYIVAPDVMHGATSLEEESILLDIFTPRWDDFLQKP